MHTGEQAALPEDLAEGLASAAGATAAAALILATSPAVSNDCFLFLLCILIVSWESATD
jgi:hypothetical protein